MTSAIARNYARALFDLAKETSTLETVEADLRASRDALHADREVADFLSSRLIGRPAKKNIVRSAFEGKVDERVLILLFLLIDRSRTRLLGEITEEYERLSRLARGVRRVKAYSAFPLGEEEKRSITRSLEARLGARVELETGIRQSLIGGVIAESEGQEIEFSIESQLKTLAANLEGR
jgi:F-type H+-transporting ATPase subunit delta